MWALPRPLRPTNLKSLNLATRFSTRAEQLRSSAEQFSSLPALSVTAVPFGTSDSMTTLKTSGNGWLDRQCGGRALHKMYGHSVRTNSPGCSVITSLTAVSIHQSPSDSGGGGGGDATGDEAVWLCSSADNATRRRFLLCWSDNMRTECMLLIGRVRHKY